MKYFYSSNFKNMKYFYCGTLTTQSTFTAIQFQSCVKSSFMELSNVHESNQSCVPPVVRPASGPEVSARAQLDLQASCCLQLYTDADPVGQRGKVKGQRAVRLQSDREVTLSFVLPAASLLSVCTGWPPVSSAGIHVELPPH